MAEMIIMLRRDPDTGKSSRVQAARNNLRTGAN